MAVGGVVRDAAPSFLIINNIAVDVVVAVAIAVAIMLLYLIFLRPLSSEVVALV